jgi:hypothetical protein
VCVCVENYGSKKDRVVRHVGKAVVFKKRFRHCANGGMGNRDGTSEAFLFMSH